MAKSIDWKSDCDLLWNQIGIVEDYTKKFEFDLLNAIGEWGQQNKNSIDFTLKILDNQILNELKILGNSELSIVNLEEIFFKQLPSDFEFEVDKKGWYGDFLSWIGTLFFVGLLFGSDDFIQNQIKEEVINRGMENFKEAESKIFDKIYSTVPITFETRIERVKEIIAQVIDSVQADLDNQDKEYQKILLYCDAEKAWIAQKRQELEQVQKNIEAILPS